MRGSPAGFVRAQYERKPIRYALVSVVAVAVSQVVLITCNGVLDWAPAPSNLMAVSVGAVPSYVLNRAWVWGKSGPNHLWREVVPFWAFALLGLAFSTLLVFMAARWNDSTVVVSLANLSAFGLLWVGKYFFLDALLFSTPSEESAVV